MMNLGNKTLTTVLMNKADSTPEKEDSVNPEAHAEEVAKELVKAFETKDSKRVLRALKVLIRDCFDEYEAEEDQFDGMKFSDSDE